MKLIILESPYAGEIDRNIEYAKRCALDSLSRGESPMLSHLLYTQFLDDNNPVQRALGIKAGLAWRKVTEQSAVYTDYGITQGMQYGIETAISSGIEVIYRCIGRNGTMHMHHTNVRGDQIMTRKTIIHRAVGSTDKNCCECGKLLEGQAFTTVGAIFYSPMDGYVACTDEGGKDDKKK